MCPTREQGRISTEPPQSQACHRRRRQVALSLPPPVCEPLAEHLQVIARVTISNAQSARPRSESLDSKAGWAEGSCPRLDLRDNGRHLCNFLNTPPGNTYRVRMQSRSEVSTPTYQGMLPQGNVSAVTREFLKASAVSCCEDTRDESTPPYSLLPKASPSSPLLIGQEAFIL